MRSGAAILPALFGVSLCLVAACGAGQRDSTALKPVATVDQVMDGIVIPSSEAVFDAVVYENGALVQAPKNADEWFRVQMHALAVAEAGNLLVMPPRARDTAEWVTLANAMTDRAANVADAADDKDVDRLLTTGGELYTTCVNCHEKYLAD